MQTLLLVGLTAVFVGYLSVWLPGPGAGLSFLGVELGEWIKFTGVGAQRDLFYVPPITLGLMLALWTARWPNHRWQTWAMRSLALAISLLAFPAVADLTGPVREQYLLRVALIGVVGLMIVASSVAARWRQTAVLQQASWLLLAVVALVGAVAPTWFYLQIRPFVSQLVGVPVGVGPGVWLTGAGHLAVMIVAVHTLLGNGTVESRD